MSILIASQLTVCVDAGLRWHGCATNLVGCQEKRGRVFVWPAVKLVEGFLEGAFNDSDASSPLLYALNRITIDKGVGPLWSNSQESGLHTQTS